LQGNPLPLQGEEMKKLDRRSFLKIGGAGLAGLAISRFDIPY
jgi:hypothetical protein